MTDTRPAPPVPRVSVVLVDDSTVVRRALGAIVRCQEDLLLVGEAANGKEALEVIEHAQPDVVVLDMEMPVLDGLGALKIMKKRWPRLPVIMFSTLTERGAEATVEALATGADDYLAKPSTMAGPDRGFGSVVSRMLPLLREWGAIAQQRRQAVGTTRHLPGEPAITGQPLTAEPPSDNDGPRTRLGHARAATAAARSATAAACSAHPLPPRTPVPIVARPLGPTSPVSAVVIGSSTGGPNALSTVVPSLPADLGVPVLVVQHMPATFTRLLAERLDRASALHVQESGQGTPVEPGRVYLAAGGYHMVVTCTGPSVTALRGDGPPENSCKPAVDVLMRSAVSVWRSGVLAVVLTGMGQDGLSGARAVVEAGGAVIVQDEATSVVWGMPGAVARAGIASEIIPLDDVAGAIARRIKPSRTAITAGLNAVPLTSPFAKVAHL